jgi:hypothetical protein
VASSRDDSAANADPNPAMLMNVRAAWKASHRLRMLDPSDGSASTVHRATLITVALLVREHQICASSFSLDSGVAKWRK